MRSQTEAVRVLANVLLVLAQVCGMPQNELLKAYEPVGLKAHPDAGGVDTVLVFGSTYLPQPPRYRFLIAIGAPHSPGLLTSLPAS